MKIECHVIQNFAPSCLNRDDTNQPKECEFGGVRRARISSQSFKRAMREYFRAENSVPVGERTKALKTEILKELPDADPKTVEAVVTGLAGMDKKRGDETNVLIFVGPQEIAALVQCVRDGITDKKKVQEAVRSARTSVDVALFGRMLAEAPDVNIDAACQVGHAVSTHAASLENDFYTAVDDLNPRDDVGAGMLGYTGYNSACLYRYALLDTTELTKNLSGDAALMRQSVEAFLWAFCNAEPSARQNSMPAHNRPSLILFVAREQGVPTSLLNAFCRPVSTRGYEPDLIGDSVTRLAAHHASLGKVYETFEGATQSLCHTLDERDDAAGLLKHLAAHDAGTLRQAIANVLGGV